MKALVDTNFLVALLDRKDSLHKRAGLLNEQLTRQTQKSFTQTALSMKPSACSCDGFENSDGQANRGLLDALERSFPPESLTWTYPGVDDAWVSIFDLIRSTGGKVNFHDALLAQAALSLGIPHIVSFDANLDEVSTWKRIGKPEDI